MHLYPEQLSFPKVVARVKVIRTNVPIEKLLGPICNYCQKK
jgi:hypothetical protein